MKKFFLSVILAAAALVGFSAHAQKAVIDSGIKGGTYDTLVNEMIGMCGQDGSIVNSIQPGGSPAAITRIIDNKATGALVQFDVLWMRSQNQDLTSIKTLIPMHQEQVHIVVQNKVHSQGGFMGYGGTKTVLNDVSSLRGLTVAAQGGSLYTAQAINQLGGLGMVIQSSFEDTNAVLKAVAEGKVAAAFIVGGSPVTSISKLTKEFRLLPFDANTTDKIKDVYRPKTVVYDNLSTTGIRTVEVDALLVVNDYKSTKMSALLNKLRTCVKDNIDDLRETAGSHPAWRAVKPDSTSNRWPVYVGKQ